MRVRVSCLFAGVVAVGLATCGGWVQAAPLDLQNVSAEARWLAHVDFQALHSSTVVEKVRQLALEKDKGAAGKLAMFQQMTGMDPHRDLFGATFYGTEIGKPCGVMIVNAKTDRGRLEGWAKALPNVESTNFESWTLFSGRQGDSKHPLPAGAYFDDEHMVVASSIEELKAALMVLAGKSASLPADAALAGPIPPGTSFLMRVNGIAQADLKCKDPVAKQTESFRMVTGEFEGKSFFRARAAMTNPEVVKQMGQIVTGGLAMAMLHCDSDDVAGKKLINAVRLEPEGKTFTLLWTASADDVWSVIKDNEKLLEKMAAKHREHMQKKHGKDQGKDKGKESGKESSKGRPEKGKKTPPKPTSEKDF